MTTTPLRDRNAALLSKIESVVGQDAVPTAGADAVLVENLRINPTANLIQTDEVTGSLDAEGPIVGGMQVQVTFDTYLKGSGAAATAPEIGPLLRACGWAETITAAAIGAAPQAAAAGSATTVTGGANFAATAQLYRGMPLGLTVNPAAGAQPFITDYTAGKIFTLAETFSPALDITTLLQIPINVLYAPASASIPALTHYVYKDGLRYRVVGSRGSFACAMTAGGVGRISWTFTGLVLDKADSAVPTGLVYDSTRPPVWRAGKLRVNRLAAAAQTFNLAANNTVPYPDDPNEAEGYGPPEITRRGITGSVNPLETLIATRDIFADFRAGTRRTMHAGIGAAAGNRIGITIPAAHYTGQTPGERDGYSVVDVPFAATGPDAGAFLAFW